MASTPTARGRLQNGTKQEGQAADAPQVDAPPAKRQADQQAAAAAVARMSQAPRQDARTEPAPGQTKQDPAQAGGAATGAAAKAPAVEAAAQVIAKGGGDAHDADELGYMGPLGPYGPLGALGPVGNNSWNPSQVISGSDWSKESRQLTKEGGPLSEAGPLGPSGPAAHAGDTVAALKPGGAEEALGPLGPLGALGPLGPLGPTGATGFKQDKQGNFTKDGKVVRAIDVPYEGGKRTEELVENYTKEQAEKMTDNDTSFMVHADITAGAKDTYAFTARSQESVTVCVVPEQQTDVLDLLITDKDGKLVGKSNTGASIEWLELKCQAGTQLKATVSLRENLDPMAMLDGVTPSYRLIVTGSGPYTKT